MDLKPRAPSFGRRAVLAWPAAYWSQLKVTNVRQGYTPKVASVQLRPVGHRRVKRAKCNERPLRTKDILL